MFQLYEVNFLELERTDQKPHFGGSSNQELSESKGAGVGAGDNYSAATEGINADEFEHIAEIYDQIRLLHQQFLFKGNSNQQIKTQIDRSLANYFDEKLK